MKGHKRVECNFCEGSGHYMAHNTEKDIAMSGYLAPETEKKQCWMCKGSGFVWIPKED